MITRSLRIALLTLLLLAGLFLAMHLAGQRAERQALRDESDHAREQLSLYSGNLRALIDRFRALPAVLALDPEIRSLLRSAVDNQQQHLLNLKLERMNRAAGSTTLELLDRTGLAVAASNWRLPTSYVGHNYGFRPYFSETRAKGSGRFYGVGVVSGIPGYFLASAVQGDAGEFLGAMVVKLEFPELEQEWAQRSDLILVSDARGVVFIANQPGWRYRELQPISAEHRAEMAATRQYDKQPLAPLIHRTLTTLGDGSRLARVDGPGGTADYLWESLPLPSEGWTLHLLRTPQGLSLIHI